MIDPSQVAAALVTRGDCDMTPVIDSIRAAGINQIVVWDNSVEKDEGIFGRYAAIGRTDKPVIVTQDDDVIVTCWDKILEAYEPGVLTVNYPQPWDVPWVAAGSIFDRLLPRDSFEKYLAVHPYDQLFTHRICDAVFGSLAENVKVIDEGYEDLPHGYAQGRVSTSANWYDHDRPEGVARCVKINRDNGFWRDYEKNDGVERVTSRPVAS